MSVLGAAIISFFSFTLLAWHLKREQLRKLAGFAMWIDICLHGTVLAMFLGTSTLGLMQAELSAIMFSLSLRGYRLLFGYRKLERQGLLLRWKFVPGRLVKE